MVGLICFIGGSVSGLIIGMIIANAINNWEQDKRNDNVEEDTGDR